MKTVSKNFGAVYVTFLVVVGLTLPVLLLNFVLVFIPVLGAILVRVYHDLDLQTAASPDVEV